MRDRDAPDGCVCHRTLASLQYAADQGFEWPDMHGALRKVEEEVREIREALARQDQAALRDEVGDLLLAALAVARYLDDSPIDDLDRSRSRFEKRFETLEKILAEQGCVIESCTLDELLACWSTAKVRVSKALERGG